MKGTRIYVWSRRTIQILVLLAFCLLPWLTALGLEGIYGSLYALEILGVPFADPVAATQVAATGFFPGKLMLAGAILSLLIAFLLGRIFCSWICPYGFFSELLATLSNKFRRNSPKSTAHAFPQTQFGIKILILFSGMALFSLLNIPLLQYLSFPGELSRLPIFVWNGELLATTLIAAALPLAFLILETLFGARIWCRHFCPQSLFLGLAAGALPKALPGLRLSRDARLCSGKCARECSAACNLRLRPGAKSALMRASCSHCGDCAAACPNEALSLNFKRQS